jgi:hypothetical protein
MSFAKTTSHRGQSLRSRFGKFCYRGLLSNTIRLTVYRDCAGEQAWKVKGTKGEALMKMAAKLLRDHSADTTGAGKAQPAAHANGAAAN